jgi:hypothetical protein
LAGGGYQSIVVTDQFPGVATGASQGLVYAYAGVPQNRQVWNYSAVDNMFHGPLPMPLGTTTFANDTASGFIPPGGSLPVVNAMAISVRNNDWRAGPPILAGESWNVFAGRDFVMAARTAPSPEFHLYDPHRDVWQPPLTTPFTTYTPGTCPTISLPGGTMMAYSAHLGTWSSISGIGTITTPGGNVYGTQNFAYFTDSTNQIRVFASPARAQVWAPWPMSRVFSIAGAVAGGATPSVGVSARGTTSQYALLYASLGLPPSPITIPGLAGTLDLDPFTAVQAADLGFFDGDGVSAVRIPIPTQVTSVTTLWFQLVTLDFATMQIELADRASSTTFF